ncbi:MAG: DUF362 domain-containing protein [Nitrospirae bacterium]|nr:DUF362 domain-containing protein [Nitrospirota bacterium]NTW66103.1 DUF362 domain-containing protein [Nitrospirota bacterium]
MDRREFLIAAGAGLALAATDIRGGTEVAPQKHRATKHGKTKVSLVRTADRASGIQRAIDLLGINPVKGKDVLLKPNFNTADPFPGSTHNDTLTHLILQLKTMGAKSVTVGERSGPPDTADVLQDKGIYGLCEKLGVGLIDFETLPAGDWVRIMPEKSSWRNGFDVARPVLESPCVVTTCCLKTHGFGGVFTMSLKLSVGITRKKNMTELHSSFLSMRRMIAEINQAYAPKLILLDGIEAFVDGGPGHGTRKRADVILAGTDRIAIDAVGIAILKELGSNSAIMEKKIFEQEQISRAVELGIGASRPQDIELVTDDAPGNEFAGRLRTIMEQG